MSQLQVTGEAKIRDIQGPVVANSGVITALDGAASQYVRGDGTLADFPTSTGGGSSVSYYLNGSVNQGTFAGSTYYEMSKTPIIGAGTDFPVSTNGLVAQFITDANDPDLLEVPGGNFNLEFYFSVSNNTGNPTVYAELYKYDGTTFTLLGSSQAVPESINQGTTIAPYYFAIPVGTAALALTDRIAIRIYANVDGRTVTLHTENSHLCQVVTTFSKGMVSLNNLTDQSQFITTGTSGTNFNIVSSGDTHTFNLPVASATNTGKLSSTDWSTFNAKQPAGNYVTLDTTQTITAAKTISGLLTVNNKIYLQTDLSTTGVYLQSYNSNEFSIGVTSGATTYYSNFILQGADRNYTFPNTDGTIALTSNIPANIVTGTGTTNTLPKFTGASTIGDSNITDTGSLITLGSNTRINTGQDGLRIGADSNLLTNSANTSKRGRINVPQYGNPSSLPIGIIQGSTDAANNSITIGGTQGGFALAADTITFQIGATYNATSGTEIARFASNGSFGIGTTNLTGFSLVVGKNITGGVNANGIRNNGIIQSDVTGYAVMYNSVASTAAASFTNSLLVHYYAQQGAIGAGSIVTNQYGFLVEATLIGATNNYGFYGAIAAGTNRWNLYMNGTANNYMAGSLGIGSTNLSGYSLRVSGSMQGVTTYYGIANTMTVQPSVTSSAIFYSTSAATAASAFTLTNLFHYQVGQGSIGAGSVVTNQYGFQVESNLTGATNNYGFFGNIPSGTNRWNLYMQGTAANYLAGQLSIGTTSLTEFVNIANSTNGVTRVLTTNINAGTATQVQYQLGNGTHNASFGLTGSAFTASGVFLQGGTYLTSGNSAGGLLLNTGAAQPIYFGINNAEVARFGTNGALGIGTTSLALASLRVAKTITGGTTIYGIWQNGTVQSDVTSSAIGFLNTLNTAAATFTLSSYTHINLQQSTIGAGSSITNQYGVFIDSLTGATNNFGFYGNIPSGTNRWNLYMNGTANNYMAGSLGIGTTSLTAKLDVRSSATAGSTASPTFRAYAQDADSYFEINNNSSNSADIKLTRSDAATMFTVNGHSGLGYLFGQLGIGVASPNASAKVQIDSTTQGFLPPRMTSAQRAAIATPATGLMVYQTDGVEGVYVYSGGSWKSLTMV